VQRTGSVAPRRAALVLLAAVATLVAGGCSSDDGSERRSGTTASTTAPSTTAAPLEPFDGPGDFYDVPDPLPEGEPGELIRYQPIERPGSDRATYRVMYHSRDARDRDVAVTGLVSVPLGDAPEGGWSTLSWGHGTVGLAPACAPSRGDGDLPAFGTDGILVASDYVGLGPNGQLHAYLSGVSEGRSVVDVVRAARRLPGVVASDEWVSVGTSQGGHAVLFAGELAEQYAPELDLVGTVSIAPGSNLDRTFPGDVPLTIDAVKAMAIYGMAVDHPEIRPEDFATPALQALAERMRTTCLDELTEQIAAMPADGYWTVDPLTTDVGKRVATANNPGRVRADAPVLLVQGDADVVVSPARTAALFEAMCDVGQVVELVTVPGGNHDMRTLEDARSTIETWIRDRLDGEPAPDGCPGRPDGAAG
jgi:fermentation-respiration switch protein FrsA (DUF1100 family)